MNVFVIDNTNFDYDFLIGLDRIKNFCPNENSEIKQRIPNQNVIVSNEIHNGNHSSEEMENEVMKQDFTGNKY